MSFYEEWGRLQAAAASHGGTAMRLNSSAGSSANSDLSVKQDDLGLVGKNAYELRSRLSNEGDRARPSTYDAAIALNNGNFRTGSAMLQVHDIWTTQLKTLLDACAHISNHLDYTVAKHNKDEADIVTSMSASKINAYFK
ncbi:MAG TPA: hypothetical protein DEQ61_23715 [Streptomyces sp.]|nr:hypothetical protein [Streptomyces sp.]